MTNHRMLWNPQRSQRVRLCRSFRCQTPRQSAKVLLPTEVKMSNRISDHFRSIVYFWSKCTSIIIYTPVLKMYNLVGRRCCIILYNFDTSQNIQNHPKSSKIIHIFFLAGTDPIGASPVVATLATLAAAVADRSVRQLWVANEQRQNIVWIHIICFHI